MEDDDVWACKNAKKWWIKIDSIQKFAVQKLCELNKGKHMQHKAINRVLWGPYRTILTIQDHT